MMVGSVSIFLEYGNGTFQPMMTTSVGSSTRPSWIVASDFNNDTKSDLAIAN